MKTQITFLILFNVLCFSSLQAQVNQEWVQRNNGSGNGSDVAHSIAVDGSGNVYVTGSSISSGSDYDYETIKYNSSGMLQWAQRYRGMGYDDIASSIAIDVSDNVYVTGYSQGSGFDYDYATIKYNSSGILQWTQRYNGTGNSDDLARSLAVDSSGNVYVTGASIGNGTIADYATIKYNSTGSEQWVARYNGPGNSIDHATSIVSDGSGNVYVTGRSIGIGTGYDYATIKYNSAGIEQWVERYNGTGNSIDSANSIALDASGNVYVTGTSVGSTTYYDYATIKYNSSGTEQWVARYNGNLYEFASSMKADDSGNVYVTGKRTDDETFISYLTIKYNSAGEEQWTARYGPGNIAVTSSLALDGSGNVYVTGYSGGFGINSNYATIKYNSSGDSLWVAKYNGPGNSTDQPTSIVIDGSGNVYVTGGSIGSGTGFDYATIKYSQLTGISQTSSLIPEKFSLSQNYPNPFNPVTKINYELRITNYVSLKVYDVLGNEVFVLVNEKQNAGSYSVDFDGSNFSSGVYFYKLAVDGNIIDTKRMVLLK